MFDVTMDFISCCDLALIGRWFVSYTFLVLDAMLSHALDDILIQCKKKKTQDCSILM